MSKSYDVIVAGGGPAGSAAALCLARAGHSVAILERSDYGTPRVGETLPGAAKAPLAQLGLWGSFLEQTPASSPAIHSAWGTETLREQDHFYNPYGAGWHIDRSRFERMIVSSARDAGAKLITGAQVSSCESDHSGCTVGVNIVGVRSSLCARVVLDATGRSSALARRLGVRRILNDNLVGVVGFFSRVSTERLPPITLVEAVENGWWYSAALPDERLVVAWMTDADLYAQAGNHSARSWLDQLGRTIHTRDRIQSAALASRAVIAQANSSRLERMHGCNWLAVGDAAMAFDPISGQGIYRALESSMHAASAAQAMLAGSERESASYAAALTEAFNTFLDLRRKFYSQETRWPTSAFWQRRQTATSAPTAVLARGRVNIVSPRGSQR